MDFIPNHRGHQGLFSIVAGEFKHYLFPKTNTKIFIEKVQNPHMTINYILGLRIYFFQLPAHISTKL